MYEKAHDHYWIFCRDFSEVGILKLCQGKNREARKSGYFKVKAKLAFKNLSGSTLPPGVEL